MILTREELKEIERWIPEGNPNSSDKPLRDLLKAYADLLARVEEADQEIDRVQSARQRETEEFMRVKADLERQVADLKDPHSPGGQAVVESWLLAVQRGEAKEGDCLEILRRLRADATRLREVLQQLVDHQNGCPLPSYEYGWTKAMELAEQALAGKEAGR